MSEKRAPYQLQLFTLRLWREVVDGEKWEWRGEIKNTTSGETRYFRDWQTLVHLLPALLEEDSSNIPPDV